MPIVERHEDNLRLAAMKRQWQEGWPKYDSDRHSMWPVDLAVELAEKRVGKGS